MFWGWMVGKGSLFGWMNCDVFVIVFLVVERLVEVGGDLVVVMEYGCLFFFIRE